MLVTDGQQAGCSDGGGNAGTRATIGSLWDDRGIGTFVVGFGGAVSPARLSEFATLGGVPRAGDPPYYQADDPAGLAAAVADIAAQVTTCDFALGEAPPDAERLSTFVDGERVERDRTHAGGWDYDAARQQVTFYGDACEAVRSGRRVDIVFGCS